MEIVHLLNADDDGEDWAFEPSDTEEEEEEGADVVAADDEGGVGTEARNETQKPLPTGNEYIDGIMRDSGLHIVREREVRATYKERGELGLFSIFFTRDFRDSLRTWTNQILKEKGKPEATVYELDAYLGLEIAMSFNPVTEMKELWSQKVFMGQSDFAATMARNRFETIRAAFQIHAPDSVPAERCDQDPLWHSRRLMTQIQKKFAAISVPIGAVSLYEKTVRTKARSSARTYLPSKPDKYGVRFYAVVGWKSLYAYSIWYNGSGNRTRATPAERYVCVFPALRTALFRTLERSDVAIKRKDASALWVAMSGHLTKIHAAPNCHRLLVCDNFYTRHNLAKTLLAFTDGEMRMLGTVRIPLQGKWNAIGLDAAKARVAAAERGSWELIAAIDVPVGWEKLQKKHNREQQKLPAHLRTLYKPPMSIAENAGYVVYRDKNTVVFYTNDLAGTMAEPMLPGASTEAVRLCRGLDPLRRWTGDQVMHRKTFQAPATVVAYNMFMNGVDRVDQLRSTNPIRRKEKRLSMSLLTWALDRALINAFALFKKVAGSAVERVTLREFKQRVAEKLTAVQRTRWEKERCRRQPQPNEPLEDLVGADPSLHAITPNSKKHLSGKLACYLCTLRGFSRKAVYGCTGCQRGFHVACFTAFHYRNALTSNSLGVRSALDAVCAKASGDGLVHTRLKKNRTITHLSELELP